MITKKCTKCKIENPLEKFHKKKNGKHGKDSQCIECKRKYGREHAKKKRQDPEYRKQELEKSKVWIKSEKGKAWLKEYRQTSEVSKETQKRANKKRIESGYYRKRAETTPDVDEKTCSTCEETKLIAKFRNGHNQCKQCEANRSKEYVNENRNEILIKQKAYNDSEAGKARKQKHRATPESKQKVSEYNKKYSKTEAGKSARHRRRMSKQANCTLTDEEWQELLIEYNGCAYCGVKFDEVKVTQDHVIPLSKGGSHTKENVVPACLKCNQKKSSKL